MERAACDIVGTSLLQSNEVTHHINNLSRVENPVYGILRYHILLFVNFFVVNILDLDRGIIYLCFSLFLRHTADFIFFYRLLHLP